MQPKAKELTMKALADNATLLERRNILFLICCILSFLIFYRPFGDVLNSTDQRDLYSHIFLVPIVSFLLIYFRRDSIFSDVRYSYWPGGIMIAAAMAISLLADDYRAHLNLNDYSSVTALAAVTLCMGSVVFFYGVKAFSRALFPLMFLVFVIPIPSNLTKLVISALQIASAEVSELLFRMIGFPFSRDGFLFYLPTLTIEVAENCSGIRSSIALGITGLLAGYFFLKTWWLRVLLMLPIFPIAVLKNATRIVTLSYLATTVDQTIITDGFLHRSGGFVFFIPALGLVALVLWVLKGMEKHISGGDR